MLKSVLLLCLCLLFHIHFGFGQDYDISTLQMLHVLHRHGDRTPLDSYPTDPYQDRLYWPQGYGQLTELGIQQAYDLGGYLRDRYDRFLTQYYLKDFVKVRSVAIQRTLMSAEAVMAGLYSPTGPEIWNTDLPWQPIPIHTIPVDLDYMFKSEDTYCPRYAEEIVIRDQEPWIVSLQDTFQDLYSYLTEETGETVENPDDVAHLYNTFSIQEEHNYTLPNWTSNVYPEPMEYLYQHEYNYDYYTKEIQRLKAGVLLNDIVQHVQNITRLGIRFYDYSAHDSNIAALMMLLDVYNDLQPPVASALLIETHSDTTHGHVMKIFYRNDTNTDPVEITLPGCAFECPLDTFISLTQSLVVTDMRSECQTTNSKSTRNITPMGIYIGAVLIILSQLLFVK